MVPHGQEPKLLLLFCSTEFALKVVVSDGGILIPGSRMEGQRIVSLREGFRKFLDAARHASIYFLLARMYRHVVGLVPNHCNKANIAVKQVT